MEQIRLGRKVRVSDPCYGTETWCAGTLDNVREGLYNVEVEMSDKGMWGNRVKSLTVVHAGYNKFLIFTLSRNSFSSVLYVLDSYKNLKRTDYEIH